jgi:hypothetical protein
MIRLFSGKKLLGFGLFFIVDFFCQEMQKEILLQPTSKTGGVTTSFEKTMT